MKDFHIAHTPCHPQNATDNFWIFFIKLTEKALPGILNETCVKPKKESTIVV